MFILNAVGSSAHTGVLSHRVVGSRKVDRGAASAYQHVGEIQVLVHSLGRL